MYVFTSSDWDLALHEFIDVLVKLLGKDLVMVVGLDESASVRDSNVLVVVKELSDDVRRKVLNAALNVNERHMTALSPYIASEGDKGVIELFLSVGQGKDDCDDAFREFCERVKGFAKELVFTGNTYVRDSNVLVVVDRVTEKVRRRLIQAELEVNDRHDCTISYYVVEGGEGDVIREFEQVGRAVKGSC